ncbi:5310_t:CDS:1, partial [Rhizophagus irregularis]
LANNLIHRDNGKETLRPKTNLIPVVINLHSIDTQIFAETFKSGTMF